MPKQQNITVPDGKAVPTNHTFQPLRAQNGVAEWAEPSSDGTLTKRNQLIFTQKLPGKGRSTVAEGYETIMPYVKTVEVNGVMTDVVHSNMRAITTFVTHPDVPKSAVKDLRVIHGNIGLNADIVAAVDDRVGMN